MIVVDTTVLVYAVGAEHPLREPCRRVVRAIKEGRVDATTSVEVVQEFVHVRARRHGRQDAVRRGRAYAELFGPLLSTTSEDLDRGLKLFLNHDRLGAFDAVLAAAAKRSTADAIVSADSAFNGLRGLRYVDPAGPALSGLLRED